MRRILPVFVALFLVGHRSAEAQGCRGMASFSSNSLQLTGEASRTAESTAIGAAIGYGLPQGPFGQLGIATRAHETFGASSLDWAAAVGYQIPFGEASRLQLCPIAGIGLRTGPNNTFNSGVDRSRRSAHFGLAVATTLSAIRQWEILPTLSLSYAYQKDQAQDDSGAVLFQIADHFALARLGVGFIFKSSLSLRPYLDLPLGIEGSEPALGLTLGYNFGRRSSGLQ